VIANNGQNGVFLGALTGHEGSTPPGAGNSVLSNSIYNNTDLGIFEGTGDSFLTAPVIANVALQGGVLTISGTIAAAANENMLVDVFTSPATSGSAQGKTFIGTFVAQTGGNTSVNFAESLATSVVQPGQVITLTITDQNGNTSEFSLGSVV
jgi:hypothetical protein